ncbi:MAG: peptide chain release factor N(5)-glutamine methyltransferase [Clostridia bacterium]|nr:peptide chain release factor N(5)-glutamine methyltransferase [Clostridia bacterium]
MRTDLFYRELRKSLLPSAGEAASYEAKEILASVLKLSESEVSMIPFSGKEISSDAQMLAKDIVQRRNGREPLEYILGYTWFYGLCFDVSRDCLIPQSDTEILCEKVISHLKKGARFADICTGSGCIALAALSETEGTQAYGYDISEGALSVAVRNADKLGVSDRFTAVRADVFASDFLADAGEFDLIASNPPYIRTDVIETLSPEVRHEPHIALDGGADGLCFYRRLLEVCPKHIKKGGALLMEIGYDQKAALSLLCEAYGFPFAFYKDFGGNDRVCAVFL